MTTGVNGNNVMPHFSEDSHPLTVHHTSPSSIDNLAEALNGSNEVILLRLPTRCATKCQTSRIHQLDSVLRRISPQLGENGVLIIVGDVPDLVHAHSAIDDVLQYQLWIAIKSKTAVHSVDYSALPSRQFGALVYSKYKKQLRHTKTRLPYTYCPTCKKTTKDYGGKKQNYHPYGTLLSDVWRDIEVDLENDLEPIIDRFKDLFGLAPYRELQVYDLRTLLKFVGGTEIVERPTEISLSQLDSKLLRGDCLEQLKALPDNSVDFAFADPPYNLKKAYKGYTDDRGIADYFEWCDQWIAEIARVLKPGCTFALLNIPLWAIRHFTYLETVLDFQNWIVWDALSFPVRQIMPAHYTILCFSKGKARPLPGLVDQASSTSNNSGEHFNTLVPRKQEYCLRDSCISQRLKTREADSDELSDVWWDIHRLKHNTRRVDHPCQLPPQLMYRLITLFTRKGEVVLDSFNGAGTTTLSAAILGRHYIGIELEKGYHDLAVKRHSEIDTGIDPFRKVERPLTVKNRPSTRLKKQKYKVSKRTLQLEVRRIAQELEHIPSRDEVEEYGEYPIEYYDEYFFSWSEATAAARAEGMKETREDEAHPDTAYSQRRLF